MNTITIIGNVGKDPEARTTQGGKSVVKFTVATQHGKEEKKTTWHNVVVFDEQAENVQAKIRKGDRVLIIGRLSKDQYEKDGVKRESIEIVADEVCLSLRWRSKDTSVRQTPVLAPEEDEEPF